MSIGRQPWLEAMYVYIYILYRSRLVPVPAPPGDWNGAWNLSLEFECTSGEWEENIQNRFYLSL